jgi:protein arginine kinase activator
MSQPCENCGRHSARFEVIERGGESPRSRHLCGFCASGWGIQVNLDASQAPEALWTVFLASQFKDAEESSALACPDCGRTFMNFERSGLLGCPECYQTFMGDMTRILGNYHGSSEHRGKVPFRARRRIQLRQRLHRSREALQLAVSEERFEDAARFRDEVEDLEKELRRLKEEGS